MKKIRTRNKVILLLLILTVGYIGKNVFDICSFSTEDQRQKADVAIIVSDSLHMKRAMLLAEDAGINAYSSPTPTSRYVSLRTKIPFLARETFYYIGYKWYRVVFPK